MNHDTTIESWLSKTSIPPELAAKSQCEVIAWHFAESISLKIIANQKVHSPYLLQTIGAAGLVVVLRFGVVVFLNVEKVEQLSFLKMLTGLGVTPYSNPQSEQVSIFCDPKADHEGSDAGNIVVHEITLEKLIVIADVVGKSCILDFYEANISKSFSDVAPLARELAGSGKPGRDARNLLRSIGRTLSMEYEMVGKAQLIDRPDILWNNTDLDDFYDRLIEEFEVLDRHQVLIKKSDLNARAAQTALNVLQHQHGARLEWYIIFLIMIEIVLELYGLYVRH